MVQSAESGGSLGVGQGVRLQKGSIFGDFAWAFYCSDNREHNIFKHPVVKEINFRYACKNLSGGERERERGLTLWLSG